MNGPELYRLFVPIKLYFTRDGNGPKFDAPKFKFKTRISMESFEKRKDKKVFHAVAKKYGNNVEDFLVSNFSVGINNLAAMKHSVYIDRKKYIDAMTYFYKEDINRILEQNVTVEESLTAPKGEHPIIIKLSLGGFIHIETAVILDLAFNYMKNLPYDDMRHRMECYKYWLRKDVKGISE